MRQERSILRKTLLTAAAAVLLSVPALAASFTDSAQITHLEAVSTLADLGILSGRSDGSFNPGGLTRRSERAKMLSLLVEPNLEGTVPSSGFPDVSGAWAERYIDHC